MSKKKFKDTKFGAFINKAKDVLPEIASVGLSVASGNYISAIGQVGKILKKGAEKDTKVSELLLEFKKLEVDFSMEMYELEIKDRDSARSREVEIAKTGSTDWLMYATGLTGLSSFMFVVYAVVYIPSIKDNPLFVHLMGMIEGIVITNLFAYYFGTSKSSKDKDEMFKKNIQDIE